MIKKVLLSIITLFISINVAAEGINNNLNDSSTYKQNATLIEASSVKEFAPSRYDASTNVINSQINKGRIKQGEKAYATAGQGITITDKYIVITQSLDSYDERYNSEYKNPVIVIDKNTFEAYDTLYESLWHANDVTYNPKTNEIVFVKRNNYGTENPGAYIVLYDANSLNHKSIIDLSTKNITGGFAVAYDKSLDKYYYGWNDRINILNSDYSQTGNYGTISTDGCKTVQSFSFINDKIYYLMVRKNPSVCSNNDGYATDDAIIYEFDRTGKYLKTYYVPNKGNSEKSVEFEGLAVDETTGIIYFLTNTYPYINGSLQTPTTALGLYKTDSNVVIRLKTNGGYLDTTNNNISTNGEYITINGNTNMHTIAYGNTLSDNGLYNYNNSDAINIRRKGYTVAVGSEWKTEDGKIYDQSKAYSALDFCKPSLTNCTVDLLVNWIPENYSITFDTNGGSSIDPIIAQVGSKIVQPTDPIKENYKFSAWYTDKELTKLYTFNTMPNQNITLYAGWVNNNYKVIKYELFGGINNESNPAAYMSGEEKTLLEPTREGYIFKGWYLDQRFENKINKIEKNMNSDITLYARWELNSNNINVPGTDSNISVYLTVIGSLFIIISIFGLYKIKKQSY